MDGSPVVGGTVAVVVVTAILSGPLVGVDLTRSDDLSDVAIGQGNATVGNVTLPETFSIERGEFGARAYYLRVPPAAVELEEVRGQPILAYEVAIDALSYERSTVHFVTAENEGHFELTLTTTNFAPETITADQYDGSIGVTLRYDETEEVLARKNVTVAVVE